MYDVNNIVTRKKYSGFFFKNAPGYKLYIKSYNYILYILNYILNYILYHILYPGYSRNVADSLSEIGVKVGRL